MAVASACQRFFVCIGSALTLSDVTELECQSWNFVEQMLASTKQLHVPQTDPHFGSFYNLAVLLVGLLRIRALLFGVCIRAPLIFGTPVGESVW